METYINSGLIATNPATNLQVQHLEDSTITADEIATALQAPPNEDTSTDGTNEPAQSDPENQAVEEDAAPAGKFLFEYKRELDEQITILIT